MNPLTSFFAWLRRKTTEAVLSGVADAAQQLDDDTADAPLAALPEALQRRLALTAPESDNGKRKVRQ